MYSEFFFLKIGSEWRYSGQSGHQNFWSEWCSSGQNVGVISRDSLGTII